MHQHFTNLVGQKRQKNSIKNNCKLLGTLGPIFQIISWHSYIPMIWKSFNCSSNHNHKKKAIFFFLTTDHKNTRCLGYSSIYICPHYVVKSIHSFQCFQTSSTINSKAHTTKVGKLRKKNIMKNASAYKS